MKSIFGGIAAAIIFLIAAACTAPEPQKVAETRYRTFSIGPIPAASPTLDAATAARQNETLRAAVAEALTSKGYTEDSSGNGDLNVRVHTEFYGAMDSTNSETRALAIFLIDSKSNTEVWKTSRGRTSPVSLQPELLRKGVMEMLASVPAVR